MAEVRGEFKDGTAVDTNIEYPVLVGGKDGAGNVQTIATDSSGNLQVDILSGSGGDTTHDSAVSATGSQIMAESAQIDGSVLPNAVDVEGDSVRSKASQEGVGIFTLAQEDGSNTPVIPHDTAIGAGFGGSTVMQGVEAKNFDGVALPNAVGAEGDAVRPAASLSGIGYTMITGEDGSSTPVIDHDAAIGTGLGVGTVIQGLESKDFDGSVLPNVVGTEGDAVRAAGSLYGVQYVMPVSEDGSQSPYDSINNALNVQEIAPAIDRYQTVEIQAATTITAAETTIGGEINVSQYNTITFFFDFTLGDETTFDLNPYFLRIAGGDEHQFMEWSVGGTKTRTAVNFQLSASAKGYITIDVTGIPIVIIKGDATGGVPTGTVQLSYVSSNN